MSEMISGWWCRAARSATSTSHAAWDVDAVRGVHAVHSVNNLGTALDAGSRATSDIHGRPQDIS